MSPLDAADYAERVALRALDQMEQTDHVGDQIGEVEHAAAMTTPAIPSPMASAAHNGRKNRATTIHCSCGTSTPHVIARRMTADGIGVALHHDGAVTGRFGSGLEGVPVVRPRTREASDLALRAGWLFLGEVSLYDYSELGALYAACRWAVAHDGLPGTGRSRMARPARLTPVWTVESADRDGRPTSRYWLPRLLSPGTVVWDHVSVAASGGRYEIHRTVRGSHGETCVPTGIRFNTLDEVSSFILTEKS